MSTSFHSDRHSPLRNPLGQLRRTPDLRRGERRALVTVDWPTLSAIVLDPECIRPEVEVKGLNVNNQGRLSLSGSGRVDDVGLQAFRAQHGLRELSVVNRSVPL
jgi:hypothetical protein